MVLIKRMRPLLGTFVELAVVECEQSQCAIECAFSALSLIQELLSFHHPNSELSRLNRAQNIPVICHPLTLHCLRLAQAMTRLSKGYYNCTLGAAIVAQGALPAQNFLDIYGDTLLLIGDWDDLVLSRTHAQLKRPLLITLDGIAKGFAVDIAVRVLRKEGVSAGWVNAGGDMRVFGDLILPVAIRDHTRQEHVMGGIQNSAIATSTSCYNDETTGLLLNSKAEPIAPATYSVLALQAWRADALTKVAAAANEAERDILIRRLGGVCTVF